MIVHNVLFKLKDPSAIENTAQMLSNMEGKIESLRSIEVGVNKLESDRAYDISLITRFDDWDGLKAYQAHPVHLPVINHMKTVAASVISVDFEA